MLARRLQEALARTRHAGARLRTQAPERHLAALAQRLQTLRGRNRAALQARMQLDQQRVAGLARALAAISPLATVARGYAILHHEDGHLVRSVLDAKPGDPIRAQLADGELQLRVEP